MDRRALGAALTIVAFGLTALAVLPGSHAPALTSHLASGGHSVSALGLPQLGVRPHPSLHTAIPPAVTLIGPDGNISGASAPITQNGNVYTLTAGFTGAIWIERNGSTLDGQLYNLDMAVGLLAAVQVIQANQVFVTNLVITNGTYGIHVIDSTNVTVSHNQIGCNGYAVEVDSSTDVTVTSNTAHLTQGIYLWNSVRVTATSNDVSRSISWAMYLYQTSDATISNNRGNASSYGFGAEYGANLVLWGNNFSNTNEAFSFYLIQNVHSSWDNGSFTSGDGFYLSETNGFWSSHDTATGAGNYGVDAQSSSMLSFTNDTFPWAFYSSVYVEYGTGISVVGCNLFHGGYESLYLYQDANIWVENTNITDYYYEGAYLDQVRNATVTHNSIWNPLYVGGSAIYTYGSQGLTISNNTALGAYLAYYDSESNQVSVSGNNFSFSIGANDAIYLEYDSQVVVSHNVVNNASSVGIYGYKTDSLTVSDNQVNGAVIAVDVEEDHLTWITGNHFGSDAQAIYIYDMAGLWVTGNIVVHGSPASGDGIYADYVTGGWISGNQISGSRYALDIEDSAGVQVTGNNASQSTYGLYASDDRNASFTGNTFWQDQYAFDTYGNFGIWIFHNNFLSDLGWVNAPSLQTIGWDAGYPGGGNFWSNLTSPDSMGGTGQNLPTGADGIVDTPQTINVTNVDHYPLAAPWKQYYVHFVETGLPTGTPWGVTVGGTMLQGTTATLSYPMPTVASSGYSYTVGSVPGYRISAHAAGTGTTSLSDQTISVTFAPFNFTITFAETGLATGATWSVTVGGQTITGTTATLTLNEPNGSYSFRVATVTGYATIANSTGTIVVSGGAITVDVQYFSTNPSGSGGGQGTASTGFTSSQFYGALAFAIIFAILAILGFALWMGSRRPKQPASAWTPPPAGGSPPPAAGSGAPPAGGTAPPPGAM